MEESKRGHWPSRWFRFELIKVEAGGKGECGVALADYRLVRLDDRNIPVSPRITIWLHPAERGRC